MMTNIFIITLLINLVYSFITKAKPNVLQCGLFGGVAKDGKKLDIKKLIILGLYNRTRGTDSCGYYYNGNIVKGIGLQSDFKDFIANKQIIPGNLPHNVMMFHTRKSTYGAHTEENAHPHEVGNYVQTHNGTIKNIWSLCTSHGVVHTNIHVDSLGLAEIINKDGFGVLNEYEGHAALTMAFKDDPRALYLYHGASRDKKDGELWEERPLFTIETAEGLYYSSIEESLHVISNYKLKPKALPHNIVYLAYDGKIQEDIFKAERESNNIPKHEVYPNNYSVYYKAPKKNTELEFSSGKFEDAKLELYKESLPIEYTLQDVYYRCGRFFGTKTYVNNETTTYTEKLLNGSFNINRKGEILEDNEKTDSKYETYYFIRGCMIESKASYEKFLERNGEMLINVIGNIAYVLSSYSKYPVICLPGEGTGVSEDMKGAFYKNYKLFNGTFRPKFSSRNYQIERGVVKSITSSYEDDSVYRDAPINEFSYVNGITHSASINNSIDFSEKDKKEEKGDEIPFYSYIHTTVEEWADRIITDDDVLKIPEIVLIYIEYFISLCLLENDVKDTPEEVLENLLRHIIEEKVTLLEQFTGDGMLEQFTDFSNVVDCFAAYDNEELLMAENRFANLSLTGLIKKKEPLLLLEDSTTVKSTFEELLIEGLEQKIEEAECFADDLQTKEDDESQIIARNWYMWVDRMKKEIKDLKSK